MTNMRDFIHEMPKAELHVHLESCLKAELMVELSRRNDAPNGFRDTEEVAQMYQSATCYDEWLAIFERNLSLLRKRRDFYDMTYSYLKEVHADNVLYTEMMFDMQAHTRRGVPPEDVMNGIQRAQQDAERNLGIRSQLIMNIWRHLPADDAMNALEQCLPYKDGIVGIGLDMFEQNHPPIKFLNVFRRARDEGFYLTAHCDVDQKDAVRNIWQCLRDLEVDRIDHGNNSLDDPELTREVVTRQICLTVCPTALPPKGGAKPVPRRTKALRGLLDNGACVTVNSDDPSFFCDWYMNDIVVGVQEAIQLTREELIRLMENAFSSAWIPVKQKYRYLAKLWAFADRNGVEVTTRLRNES